MLDNVSHIKKGLGPFGQLLPETQGHKSGSINLKQTVFYPYVNSLRLLAMKERIFSPSTLSRFQQLPQSYENIKTYQNDFIHLVNFRLYFQKNADSYENVHFLNVERLSKLEKYELKHLIKQGYKLFSNTKAMIEKGCSRWS